MDKELELVDAALQAGITDKFIAYIGVGGHRLVVFTYNDDGTVADSARYRIERIKNVG